MTNHLFRDIFARADDHHRCDEANSLFRPHPTNNDETAPEGCLVHDLTTQALYSTNWYVSHRLVTAQIGGGIKETLAILKWKNTSEAA